MIIGNFGLMLTALIVALFPEAALILQEVLPTATMKK